MRTERFTAHNTDTENAVEETAVRRDVSWVLTLIRLLWMKSEGRDFLQCRQTILGAAQGFHRRRARFVFLVHAALPVPMGHLPGGQTHSKLPLVLTQPWSQLSSMLRSSTSPQWVVPESV